MPSPAIPSKPRIWHWIWHLHPPCTHCRPCARLKPCGQDAWFAYIFLGVAIPVGPSDIFIGCRTRCVRHRTDRTAPEAIAFTDRAEASVRATFRIGTWHWARRGRQFSRDAWLSCDRRERRPGARERIHRAAARAVDMIEEAGFCGINHLEMGETKMLWTIAVILVVLWLLGLVSSYTLGGFIHILLVLAIVIIVINLIQGRRGL
jgi:hypothetical protein